MDRRSFLKTTAAAAGTAAIAPAFAPAVSALPFSGDPAATDLRNSVRRDWVTGGYTAGVAKGGRVLSTSLATWVPSGQDPWDVPTIHHLYRRAGFGARLAEIEQAKAKAHTALVSELLDDALTKAPNLPTTPTHFHEWMDVDLYRGTDNTLRQQQQLLWQYGIMEIRRWWAQTMSEPKTMLREKLVLFWMNHFVIESNKVNFPQMVYTYLDYLRRNPWGNFKQMVKDITIQPAMLLYLDGYVSNRLRPNENYGRELLELFTVGESDRNGVRNYTEEDIREIAKALTGYTLDTQSSPPALFTAVYRTVSHDATFKQPFKDLGAPRKQYGLASAGVPDDVIDLIFEYRKDQIASYICQKLYKYFVYAGEPGVDEWAVIDQMAEMFKTNWELKPVIEKLLTSEHFFDKGNIGAAIKSPMEYILGMTRNYDLALNEFQAGTVVQMAQGGEQFLLDPPNVKGWPGYHAWVSTSTLPQRNTRVATALAINKMLPALGATGFGENHQAINFTDQQLIAWAKQFKFYSGEFNKFLTELATFICGIAPSEKALKERVEIKIQKPYEWPGLKDNEKVAPLRTMLNELMLLAEYQLC